MQLFEHPIYQQEIRQAAEASLPWEQLKNQSVLISGASGLIGSFLVDVLMYRNRVYNMHCDVIALGRNAVRAKERFAYCWETNGFQFVAADITQSAALKGINPVDYIVHLASNTHPVAYAVDPIGTIATNIIGTNHLLEFAAEHGAKRFVFASTVEVYGENRGDTEKFSESYCGYLNCNTLRAGYPESKRCGEALCQAYASQKGVDVVIPRLARSYGPTLLDTDTKALSQFLHKGIIGEDIVLKSEGTQFYSYTYVADAVSGLLTVLLCGKPGEAYNIADEASDIMLKDLAQIVADCAGKKVVFELPDAVENAGYSKALKARMDNDKLRALGWTAKYDLRTGIEHTLQILKAIKNL